MRHKILVTLVCSAVAVTAAIPVTASAEPHRVRVCRDESSRGARNTGTAVGAVGGALAGAATAVCGASAGTSASPPRSGSCS